MKSPKMLVGTSGYVYFWNKGKPSPFEWYLKQAFNSVEINASFYRFPANSWLKAWSKAPDSFIFSIKVHRSITHYTKLRGKALDLWYRFRAPLEAIAKKIEFWLFQMPPTFVYSEKNVEAMAKFFSEAKLGNSAVVEFRHGSWWRHIRESEKIGVAFCSIDAPELPRDILAVNDVVYLRLHGREEWYSYVYSKDELNEILSLVIRSRASRKAIFLNNDIGMLENGRYLLLKAGLL